jgi:hypothetical protein
LLTLSRIGEVPPLLRSLRNHKSRHSELSDESLLLYHAPCHTQNPRPLPKRVIPTGATGLPPRRLLARPVAERRDHGHV